MNFINTMLGINFCNYNVRTIILWNTMQDKIRREMKLCKIQYMKTEEWRVHLINQDEVEPENSAEF